MAVTHSIKKKAAPVAANENAGASACLFGRDRRLSSEPLVAMMEAADLREWDNLARSRWVYRTALRTILVEREMRSRLVVIVKVRRQHAAQVTLIEDDEVIETFAAD